MVPTLIAALCCLLLLSSNVQGHIAVWHPSVYGVNASGFAKEHWFDKPINTNFIVVPLRYKDNLTYDQWMFHGMRGAKPDAIMDLPVGTNVTLELSCNKAYTSMGVVPAQLRQVGNLPCNMNVKNGRATYGDPRKPATNGALHAADEDDLKGCALSIAYKSDINQVSTEDLTVFSVQPRCVWTRLTDFEVPQNMPPCPPGGCICAWNWIHGTERLEGYEREIYMTGFNCNITGSTSTVPLAKPKVPLDCTGDPSKCVSGAKQGLYWRGAVPDGGNVPYNPRTLPPSYGPDWGFLSGAQNDIFENDIAEGAQQLADAIRAIEKRAARPDRRRLVLQEHLRDTLF